MHYFEVNIRLCQPKNSNVHWGEKNAPIVLLLWHCLWDFLWFYIKSFHINWLKLDVHSSLKTRLLARWLRAKFWPHCAIPDTSMKFGTVVDHDWLSRKGYRTTFGNAYCACAKHFLILGCYHSAFIQFDLKEGVMLAVE